MSALGYDGWVRGLRPVSAEGVHGEAACIAGAVPSDLRGTLYRCGPSQRLLPPQGDAGLHLFDGDGLVQKLDLRDGRVTHTNRFVRTASFVLEQQAGTFNQDCLGTRAAAPARGVPMRQQQNTNVVAHAGRLLALVESAAPVEIAFDSLRRIGEHDFGLRLAGRPLAAHPKIDARTGELFVHSCYPIAPHVQLHAIDASGRPLWAAAIDVPFPAWVHDIAITTHYVVVPLSPVAVEVERVDGRWIPTDPYAVRPGEPLRWLVCSRHDGRVVARTDAREAGLVVHCGRAFEDGGDIVVEAVTYDDPASYLGWLKVARSGGWVPGSQARYARHRLRLDARAADATTLVARASEFPRVDDRTIGGDSRYTYLAVGDSPADARSPAPWSRIAKLDARTDALEEHALPADVWAGEPVFAPRAGATGEDDGYVLVVTYDARADRSLLFVLDARAIASPPVAVIALGARIPFGFHGSFVS